MMTKQDPNLDRGQTTQRVKVGMIGLAAVLLLIGLAAAIFSTASRERAVAGGANPDVVANLTIANGMAGIRDGSEPLADLGVAPSTAIENSSAVAPASNTAMQK
ncbi:MAG: hypothetical protein M3N02_00750 [Pseudomonadota bacterium]|jgi:hypothetical protein|uniref:hypothetical protein n=1 Tax=Sphingomonas sp. TaxID=28214 RepID=UPI0025DBAED7|nr:hypothetical protein [Sphingomonas sp.]MDP9085283.1 hypothetical protein [Pseudomonadota bacterium]